MNGLALLIAPVYALVLKGNAVTHESKNAVEDPFNKVKKEIEAAILATPGKCS